MGVGYTRQSSSGIQAAQTITAAKFNAEFNQLEAAFAATTGHNHDGSTGSGGPIALATAVTGTLAVANGGTGSSTASAARTALGLAIGTNVQAYNANLAAIAGLTSAADKLAYFTGSGTAAVSTITSFARTMLANSTAANWRSSLGVVIGTDVQAYDATIVVDADIGVTVQAYDADTLKSDTTATLTAGYTTTSYNAGTKSSGTFTPSPALGNMQYAVNGGAHTLAPPSSDCTMVIQYTNNGSAGTITTSGFTIVDGDTITTTNGNDFLFYITKCNGFSFLNVKALQ